MFMKVGKRFGWLAGLALAPVVEGQEIIRDPQNATVCVEEKAVFTAQAIVTGFVSMEWLINGTFSGNLPLNIREKIQIIQPVGVNRKGVVTFNYNKIFNGITVQCLLASPSEEDNVYSQLVYLFYQPNQQFPVTALTHTITNNITQVYWNELESNFTTRYLFGVYDANNNLVANYTLNTTHFDYELPSRTDGSCQPLTVKVTANQCPDTDNGFDQTEAATFTIPCSTTETEIPDQPSGAQAAIPSWLAVAAMVPLLRIARPAF